MGIELKANELFLYQERKKELKAKEYGDWYYTCICPDPATTSGDSNSKTITIPGNSETEIYSEPQLAMRVVKEFNLADKIFKGSLPFIPVTDNSSEFCRIFPEGDSYYQRSGLEPEQLAYMHSLIISHVHLELGRKVKSFMESSELKRPKYYTTL